jgi:hypothetical protein
LSWYMYPAVHATSEYSRALSDMQLYTICCFASESGTSHGHSLGTSFHIVACIRAREKWMRPCMVESIFAAEQWKGSKSLILPTNAREQLLARAASIRVLLPCAIYFRSWLRGGCRLLPLLVCHCGYSTQLGHSPPSYSSAHGGLRWS